MERYGYCAHNWWLARKGVDGSGGEGVARHATLGEAQKQTSLKAVEAREWLRWSFRVLAVAASIAFLTLELVFLQGTIELDWAFLLLALVALSMSAGLFVIALVNRAEARKKQIEAGLIPGDVLDSDLSGDAALLHDPEWDITGRPDYTINTQDGIIPVEVKTGNTPRTPYPSHVLQVACYLRLLEATQSKPPKYGLITYPDGTFRVEWDDRVKAYLRGTLANMKVAEAAGKADRDHEHPGRCKGCARRDGCDQRLA